jgi:hypothetical protein
VTAGKDQAQPIVFDKLPIGNLLGRKGLGVLLFERVEARAPGWCPPGASRRSMPSAGARILRHAFARPLLERGAECIVQRFLGEVEVAEQAHQCREDATRLRAVNRLDFSGDRGRTRIVLRIVR